MFLPKIAGTDLYQLDEFFGVVGSLLILLRLLGHVDGSGTNLLRVLLRALSFFCSITTPNLLLLCFCQKLQVPIFIVWAFILGSLIPVCFC